MYPEKPQHFEHSLPFLGPQVPCGHGKRSAQRGVFQTAGPDPFFSML